MVAPEKQEAKEKGAKPERAKGKSAKGTKPEAPATAKKVGSGRAKKAKA
jgi:hypothetical protein